MTDEAATWRQALTLDAMIGSAQREAGLRFRDLGFVPALQQVLDIATRMDFSVGGLQIYHANITRCLVNRLRYQDDVAKHPEILDEDVSDPIVVIGLPRSGTTKLQRILSADPHVQATHTWRMFNPAPFPGEKPGDPTPRIEWAEAMAAVVSASDPDFIRIHEYDARAADETCYIELAAFDSVMQLITTPDPIYKAWVRAVDRRSPLTFMKQMLQYMQWQDGGRRDRPWLIKNPGHTGEVAELLDVFPGATFIMPERAILPTMSSNIQMMYELRRNSFASLDRREHAETSLEYWSHELNAYHAARERLGDRLRVVEAPYKRLLADPVGLAREVFALHGRPLTEEGAEAIRQWERDNPAHKFGKFDYDIADYGMTDRDVEAWFGETAERWRNY